MSGSPRCKISLEMSPCRNLGASLPAMESRARSGSAVNRKGANREVEEDSWRHVQGPSTRSERTAGLESRSIRGEVWREEKSQEFAEDHRDSTGAARSRGLRERSRSLAISPERCSSSAKLSSSSQLPPILPDQQLLTAAAALLNALPEPYNLPSIRQMQAERSVEPQASSCLHPSATPSPLRPRFTRPSPDVPSVPDRVP